MNLTQQCPSDTNGAWRSAAPMMRPALPTLVSRVLRDEGRPSHAVCSKFDRSRQAQPPSSLAVPDHFPPVHPANHPTLPPCPPACRLIETSHNRRFPSGRTRRGRLIRALPIPASHNSLSVPRIAQLPDCRGAQFPRCPLPLPEADSGRNHPSPRPVERSSNSSAARCSLPLVSFSP